MVELINLEIGYKEKVAGPFNGVFEIGDIVILRGDNGKGKSTLIKTIAGVLKARKGDVISTSDQIGWVQSDMSRFSFISVYDYLTFGSPGVLDHQIQYWLNQFNLKGIGIKSFVEELSDGQFRKLSIIRQLIKKVDVLLLDEPTVYLDESSKIMLVDVLKRIQSKVLIFCATHDVWFAKEIGNKEISF